MIQLVLFHTSLLLVDADILSLLTNADNPFPRDQNMVDVKFLKGKTKVLTSTRAKETETVDLEMQISTDEYREIKRRHDQQKSLYEQGEPSRNGAMMPHVTSQILLNKW